MNEPATPGIDQVLFAKFLDDLSHARSITDVNIAAGSAAQDLVPKIVPTKARVSKSTLLAIAATIVLCMVFAMAVHPGNHLDRWARDVGMEAT